MALGKYPFMDLTDAQRLDRVNQADALRQNIINQDIKFSYQVQHKFTTNSSIDENELSPTSRIFKIEEQEAQISEGIKNFVSLLLEKNPDERVNIQDVVQHPWLKAKPINELYTPLNNFYLHDIFEENLTPTIVSDYVDREKLPASPESVPPPLLSKMYCSTAEPSLPGISRAMESMTAIRQEVYEGREVVSNLGTIKQGEYQEIKEVERTLKNERSLPELIKKADSFSQSPIRRATAQKFGNSISTQELYDMQQRSASGVDEHDIHWENLSQGVGQEIYSRQGQLKKRKTKNKSRMMISEDELTDFSVIRRLLAQNDIPFTPAVMDVISTFTMKYASTEIPLAPLLKALKKVSKKYNSKVPYYQLPYGKNVVLGKLNPYVTSQSSFSNSFNLARQYYAMNSRQYGNDRVNAGLPYTTAEKHVYSKNKIFTPSIEAKRSPPLKKLSNQGLPRKTKRLERKDTTSTVAEKSISPLKSVGHRDQERSNSPGLRGSLKQSPNKFSLPPISKNGRFSPQPPNEESKISSGRQLRSSIEKNNKIRSISSLAPPDTGKISEVRLPYHPKSPQVPPRRSLKGIPTKFGRAGKNIIHLEPSSIERNSPAEELQDSPRDFQRIESTRSFSPKKQYDSIRSEPVQLGNSKAGAIRPIPTALVEASRNQVSRGIIKTRKTTERLPINALKVNITTTKIQKFNSSKSNKLSERMVEKLGIKEEGKVYFYK